MSDLVTTKIKGIQALNLELKKIDQRIAKEAAVELTKYIAQTIAREARKKVPVKTGNLKKSIKTRRVKKNIPTKIIYHVGQTVGKKAKNDGWYGRLVELGTIGPYEIPSKDSILKRERIAMKIDGSFVGGIVSHPGSKKSPFMRPAFDEYWPKGLRSGIKRAIKIIERPIKGK